MNKRETSALLTRAAEMAIGYVSAASERRVAPAEAALAALERFHEPFPESAGAVTSESKTIREATDITYEGVTYSLVEKKTTT